MLDEKLIVGKRVAKEDAEDIVCGMARYVPDFDFPEMLVGKLLYTSYPSARIKRIDVNSARSHQCVHAIITHFDIPGENSYGHVVEDDQPVLAVDYVRYQGEVLAAIAAEDKDTALSAMNMIEVDYEPIEGVFDPLEAMKPDAPQVWPGRENICAHWTIKEGDIETGFRDSDVVIENIYYTQMVEHAYLETEGAVARIDNDGTVVVYSCCQDPHSIRRQIARVLSLPANQVRVVVPSMGGGFGGKAESHVEIYAALLAYKTKKPVRIVRTREESIRTHSKRHPIVIHYRTGAKADGTLTAVQIKAIGDTGPYLGPGPQVMGAFSETASGPYVIPHSHIEAYTVYTNNPTCGAFRGFGATQANFAAEVQIDELAKILKMDPMEIRLKNCLKTGTHLPTGVIIREGKALRSCLQKVADLSDWEKRGDIDRQPKKHIKRGWGMALSWHVIGYGGKAPNHAGVIIDMAQDGSVIIRTGVVEMGQGIHTALAQISAEALGVKISSIRVIGPDTDKTVDAGSTEASRAVYISGNAVLRAAETIRQSLLETAAEETGLPIEGLSLQQGWLYMEGEKLHIDVPELAHKAWLSNRQLHSDGFYAMERPEGFPNKEGFPFSHQVFSYGAQVARVLVDIETGQVVVEDLIATHGVGRIINPDGARGQVLGGCTMGLGYALMEELIVSHGQIKNSSLENYLIPTSLDVPEIKTSFIEVPEPYAPYGAKGLGELPINATAPSVINAISDALGVPIRELPMTPERVIATIENASINHM